MIYSKINDDDVQCTICATDLVFLVQRVDKYAYYSCPNCTLITAVPKPTDLEIASFYNGFLYGMPKDEHFLGELEAKKKAVVRIDLDIKKYFNKTPLSLLDLGGGTGFYSECFKNLGYKTTLIDIDQKACNYAASHFRDIKVVNVDPFNYSPEEKYDVVFTFLSTLVMPEISTKIKREMRSGTLFISSSFPVTNWQPENIFYLNDRRKTVLFCYRLP